MTAPSAHQRPVTVRAFIQRFSSTPRGARLARHLAQNQLHGWGIPHGTEVSDTAAVPVAELAANAVTHGRVPGRDFELRIDIGADTLRIEVSDTRTERRPPSPPGRGLALAGPRGVRPRTRPRRSARGPVAVLDRVPVGKTVRAELDLPPQPC